MAVEKVSKVGKGIELPEGPQLGLFVGLVHLGIQRGEYKGVVSYKDQVLLKFELPEITMDDGRPICLTKRETHSLKKARGGKESNLLKLGRAFNHGKAVEEAVDWEASIGLPVMLELKKNEKGNVNIGGYSAVHESLRKNLKPLINEPILLLDVDAISEKELKEMPEWLQKVINGRGTEEGDVEEGTNY